MPNLIIKLVKVVLYGILILLGAACAQAESQNTRVPAPGLYELTAEGTKIFQLHGNVVYELVEEEGENGSQSILKLHLTNSEGNEAHYLGFVLANPDEGLAAGNYNINGDVECFLSKFKGVFAFASINFLGEYPFFAKKGILSIQNTLENALQGNISITMENSNGASLDIRGKFSALKKNTTFQEGS